MLVGGRVSVEDAYGYSKFARVSLNTNDIDFRARLSSDEESDFLAAKVVGSKPSYKDIDKADSVLLVGFEPEEESPIVFLRIYKQVRKRALTVVAIASKLSPGNAKLRAQFISITPGAEADAIAQQELTGQSIILVGERASESAGALSAVVALAERTGAIVAWIPRRAGERGALEAGAIGNLLPGGRPVEQVAARVDLQAAWGVDSLPTQVGMSAHQILTSVMSGEIAALVIGGVDPLDSEKSHQALLAMQSSFVVSLEIGPSVVTQLADVVLPVAAVTEKSGSFMSWEGRSRSFEASVETLQRSDVRILSMIADAMGRPIDLSTVKAAAKEFAAVGNWDAPGISFSPTSSKELPKIAANEALLTSWRLLLDSGSLQEGEENLAGTARKSLATISAKRAAELGVVNGDALRVSNAHGAVVLPAQIGTISDDAVWLPRNSRGSHLLATLGVASGAVVTVVRD